MNRINIDQLEIALNKKNIIEVKLLLESSAYSFYTNLVEKFNNNIKISRNETNELEMMLYGLEYLYINGEISPLRDDEYDTLHLIYNNLTGKYIGDKFENSKGKKIEHEYPDLKGTLDKAHYIAESDKTKNSIKTHKSLEKFFRDAFAILPKNKKYSIGFFFKYDGISAIFSIKNNRVVSVITRGDMDTGEGSDKTNKFSNIVFDLKEDEIGMKTEIVMDKTSFDKFVRKYKDDNKKMVDPRSVVSGIVNSEDIVPEWMGYLTIVPLMYQNKLGELYVPEEYLGDTTQLMKINIDDNFDVEDIRTIIKIMKNKVDNYNINCDGIVVRFLDKDAIELLGRNYERSVNKFEIAYKFPPDEKETILKDVVFNVGKIGKISAVAKIEPVEMKKRTVKSVSLGSIDRFKGLGLHYGDIVTVKYDIIPYLTKGKDIEKHKGELIELIEKCPECGNVLEYNPELMCVNSKCPSRIIGKILNYCQKMGIEYLGESTIEEFFNRSVLRTIEDLYKLKDKKDIVINISGFGEKKFAKIIDSINKHNRVEAYTLLGSLGIPSIGRKIFKKILNIYYLSELMEFTLKDVKKLIDIPGIQEITAKKIINGLTENKDTIIFILDKVEIIKNKSNGNNLVFTNVRNYEFEHHLVKLGYEISDSVNKQTLYVITDSLETDTGKIKKAKETNVPILTIEQAYKAFGF